MGHRYVKLFEQILESTVWCEPAATRLVWITMLAMSDKDGAVLASVPGLANRAKVAVPDCRAALARFQQPDEDSRTKDHEGRRIEEIDGGWRLLNHAKYRALMSAESERERKKQWWRENRSKSASVREESLDSTNSTQAEASTEAETTTTPRHSGVDITTSRATPQTAALLALCAQNRVKADSARALAHIGQWATEGLTPTMLAQAIRIARDTKPDPAVIPLAYLVPIVAELKAGNGRHEPRGLDAIPIAIANIAAREAAKAKAATLDDLPEDPPAHIPDPPGSNVDLDFRAHSLGMQRLPGEPDDQLQQRIAARLAL